VRQHAERHATRAAARHLLAQHHAREKISATTSVLDRELEPEEAERAESAPELARDLSRVLPGLDVRHHLLLDEGADGPSQRLVLGREERMAHCAPQLEVMAYR